MGGGDRSVDRACDLSSGGLGFDSHSDHQLGQFEHNARRVRPAETEVMVSPFHPCTASRENVVRRQLWARHELAYLMSMGAKKQ